MIHVVDRDGRYLGVFVGSRDTPPTLPAGAVAVPSPPPHPDAIWTGTAWDVAPALPAVKSEALAELRRAIEDAGQSVVAKYPQIVREGWPEKLREARALAADPAAQTTIIAAEAAVLGIMPDALAQKVLANADAFARINGTLSGLLTKHAAAIQAASDPAGVNAALAAAQTEIANALAAAGI